GDAFVQEKLNEAVGKLGYAIVGLAGSDHFRIDPNQAVTMWLQPPAEGLSGAVEHTLSGATTMAVYGPTHRRCIVMDGLFLAVDLARIGRLRFDEQFKFHFYDLDLCLTAHREGLVLGTTNVYVNHKSGGGYTTAGFREAQAIFRAKWQGKGGNWSVTQPSKDEIEAIPKTWTDSLAELPVCLPMSAWTGHIPFLFLLFRLAKPRVYVELGVDLG